MELSIRKFIAFVIALGAALSAACSSDELERAADDPEETREPAVVTAPEVSYKPSGAVPGAVGKPTAPFQVQYKIIGTPIVGSSVPIELRIIPANGPRPMRVSYNINDASALEFPAAQPASVNLEPAANERLMVQTVTVIPKREGRLYVNVAVSVETEEGARSMVMAIPIQVGEGSRPIEENGELKTDEQGEAIRSLPGKDD